MATESIIITSTDGTTDYTFYKVSQTGTSQRYAYSANTNSLRWFLDIDLKVAPTGSQASDVYTLTFRDERLDTDTNRYSVAKCSLQLTVPKGDTITTASIKNDLSCLMSLFNKNFMDSFQVGIVLSGDYNVTGPFNPARA